MRNSGFCAATWRCCYHLAFAPSNRALGAYRMVRCDMEAILQRLCRELEVGVLLLKSDASYVHMRLNIPPWYCPLVVVQYLRAASSIELLRRYPHLAHILSDRMFWADGFLLNTRAPSKQVIQNYINKQLQADWVAECGCTEASNQS